MQNQEDFITIWKGQKKYHRESVFCHKGGHESGWINSDLVKLTRDLNCKTCGKVCIRFNKTIIPYSEMVKDNATKIHYRGGRPKKNKDEDKNSIEDFE